MAIFDHIYLARTIAALDEIDFTGLSEGGPLALTPDEVEEHYGKLNDPDASVAYRSFWMLVAAGDSARAVLEGKVGGGVTKVDAAKIEQWLKELDHDEYAVRERATAELTTHYHLASAAIDEALKGTTSIEVRTRLGMILANTWTPKFKFRTF